MKLYQVILNKLDEQSPIFETRDEATALVRKYRDYMVRRGCHVVNESEDYFHATWGEWSGHHNYMYIREIMPGVIPRTWMEFGRKDV